MTNHGEIFSLKKHKTLCGGRSGLGLGLLLRCISADRVGDLPTERSDGNEESRFELYLQAAVDPSGDDDPRER